MSQSWDCPDIFGDRGRGALLSHVLLLSCVKCSLTVLVVWDPLSPESCGASVACRPVVLISLGYHKFGVCLVLFTTSSWRCRGGGWADGGSGIASGLQLNRSIGHRNRLLQSIIRQLPSTTTLYWWFGRVSAMNPVLFHFVGWLSCWFWIWTEWPMLSGSIDLDMLRSACWTCLLAIASSRLSAICCHPSWSRRSWMGRWSCIGLPKSAMAGEIPFYWQGVFLWVNRAFTALSLSSFLVFGSTLPRRIRLAVLTPASALPLLWG